MSEPVSGEPVYTILPKGIISVIQTPFTETGQVDYQSLEAVVEQATSGGVDGLLTPVVASENAYLSSSERFELIRRVAQACASRVPYVAGASDDDPALANHAARLAEDLGATAYLVAVPQHLYEDVPAVVPYLRQVAKDIVLPLILQDFQLLGPGIPIDTIIEAADGVRTLAGVKIETTPAGPKYTAIRDACGPDFFICGGWAVQQMIEALDRGVDAMVPESSMVRVYKAIHSRYVNSDREGAKALFNRLLPILAFTNQDVPTSIAFFKRLLVRKGVFASAHMRMPELAWDHHSSVIADELIDYYLDLESSIGHEGK